MPCAPAMVEWVKQAVHVQGLPMRSGGFVTVPRVLCLAEENAQIAGAEAGIGLDMESRP